MRICICLQFAVDPLFFLRLCRSAWCVDDADKFRNVAKRVKDLDVGVLVNNVGKSYPHAQYLAEVDAKLPGVRFDMCLSFAVLTLRACPL